MRRSLASLSILLLLPAPIAAQDLSDEDLLQRFEAQRDALAAAEAGDLGRTRGLELITVDDLSTQPELAGETPPSSETAPGGADGTVITAAPDAGGPEEDGASPGAPGSLVVARFSEPDRVDVRVNFAFDSATLADDQIPRLEQICRVMKRSDIGLFRIIGHTDAAGTDEYNERLSLLRAEEVERYLVNTCGIAPSRLEAVGMGERLLADPADPEADGNRRVEFQALS